MNAPRRPPANPILVVVSLDVEEDNWNPSRKDIGVSNVRALPLLRRTFARFGVRPTYFTTYQVARIGWAADMLRDLQADESAEVGAHLHPWNTPPLTEAFVGGNTMMNNLPLSLQWKKLTHLTDTLEAAMGTRPTSFRAGRYGIGPNGAALLARCRYRADSSVTPFTNWSDYDHGPDFSRAPLEMYRPSPSDISVASPTGAIVEVPVSVGFNRRPFERWHGVHEKLRRIRVGPLSLASLAYRTHLLRKTRLSPETDTVDDMLTLSRHIVAGGGRLLHLTWHSPSMRAGLSPFVAGSADLARLSARIEQYLDRLAGIASFTFATVGEAAATLPVPMSEESICAADA